MGERVGKLLSTVLFGLGLILFGLYFVFKEEVHVVKFDSNGGSAIESQKVKDNELAVRPSNPQYAKKAFDNWYLNDKVYDFSTAVVGDITLVAKWKDLHNVVVLLDDKEYTSEIVDGEKIDFTQLNIEKREGYGIRLYDDDEEYDIKQEVVSDLSLRGEYYRLQKFVVKFNSNGAGNISNSEVWEGDLVKEPSINRDGYIFDGWYLDGTKYSFDEPVKSNLVLEAKWTEKGKVNVNFQVDGKVIQTVSVNEGTSVTEPSNPQKRGYIFLEWQINGKKYDFNTKVTKEITLIASFKEAKEYTVTFNYDNGSASKVEKYYENEIVTKPATPTKNGHRFVEWQLNNQAYDFNNPVSSNITLIAKWAVNVFYTVSFDSKGGTPIDNQMVEKDSLVTRPSNPQKDNYKFIEWRLNNQPYNFNSPVNDNITLEAYWQELAKFLIQFDSAGGDSVPSQMITEGDKVIEPLIPTRDGYDFIEWQLNGQKYDFSKPVTSSITLIALWDEK